MTTPKKSLVSLAISLVLTGGFFVIVSPEWETIGGLIILAALFFTIFLITFFLFNLRQDPVTIVQNRLKTLHISLIEQIYENKGEFDSATWSRELEQRRRDISNQLKQGLGFSSQKEKEDIEALINSSWDELIKNAAASGKAGQRVNPKPKKTGGSGLLQKAAAVAEEYAQLEEMEEFEIVSPFSSTVIKEREGIPYVNEDALKPESESSTQLNRDFKDLVDSVVKN